MKTLKNKIVAVFLTMISLLPNIILHEKDITVFVMILMISLPLFFAKENVIR